MTAFNVVRMKVKPGKEKEFLDLYRAPMPRPAGGIRASIIRTGERSYCMIGEWENMDALAAARPAMIANLDRFRDMLEDLGGGLGVTDPVSGEVALELK